MKTPLPNTLAYAEHASEIVAKGAACIAASERFALITSLAIEGGAARAVGSLALVDQTGLMTGYLSNGCIDRDIQLHAMDALQTGQKKLIRYGDGSRYADLKLPCGGALTVLIDPAPDHAAITAAHGGFLARKPISMDFQGTDETGATLARRFTYAPQTRLVLAGRGAIFRSVAQIAHATGYDLRLLSPEAEDLAAIGHLASADPVHLTTPDGPAPLDGIDAYCAFLTLFHDHDWEPSLLKAALDTSAGFIGSLGSQRTHAMRCATLADMGIDERALKRLRGPIGLVPSLRDASSIAVSTLAEIVAAFPEAVEMQPDNTIATATVD
ncbi:XdhC family protein [Yoonia sp. BS5-3]|uniref:XdhC family protein n=1 Tax=Yoonia phaeophyticola TaxID=3137369 RepID=A0ABZ2V5C2_9RHOB